MTYISIKCRPHIHLICLLLKARMTPQMAPYNELRQQLIHNGIHRIFHDT